MLLFTQSREIHTVKPTAGVPGPELRILQIVR